MTPVAKTTARQRTCITDCNCNAALVVEHCFGVVPTAFGLLTGYTNEILVKAADCHGAFVGEEVIKQAEGDPRRFIRRGDEGVVAHEVGFQCDNRFESISAVYRCQSNILIADGGEKVIRTETEYADIAAGNFADGHIAGLREDFIIQQPFGVHRVHILENLFPSIASF